MVLFFIPTPFAQLTPSMQNDLTAYSEDAVGLERLLTFNLDAVDQDRQGGWRTIPEAGPVCCRAAAKVIEIFLI
ncbi:MAG: hypothetical protein ACFB2Z_04775 [Maricaulaceae bacterium]